MSYNRTIIVGRIATDLELRYTAKGTPVTNFRIAFDSGYGENQKTVFMGVVVFGKQAESANTYLEKGREVLIEGEITEQSWEADGQKRTKIEIVANHVKFLGGKSEGNQSEPQASNVTPF